MEQPMFYQGQRVVFVGVPSDHEDKDCSPLIEGKSYYVENPNVKNLPHPEWGTYIELSGITWNAYDQRGFIPYDTDQAMENEIHQALKEDLKIKI